MFFKYIPDQNHLFFLLCFSNLRQRNYEFGKENSMQLYIKNTFITALSVATLLIMGCANTSKNQNADADRLAMCQERFSKIDESFKKQEYGKIKVKLEELLTACPGTGFMEQAQFMLAESHFHLEEWIEARGEYGSFILNFPGSPFIETAEFRKAVSSFNMEYHIARDETQTAVAMKDFERFASNYPESPLKDSVTYYYDLLLNRLAEKDYQTANLYYKLEKPKAVIIYLKDFLANYPKNQKRFDAFLLMARSYSDLDQFDMARLYLKEASESTTVEKQKKDKEIKSLESHIASAEVRFEKKLKEELSQKRIKKIEAEDYN